MLRDVRVRRAKSGAQGAMCFTYWRVRVLRHRATWIWLIDLEQWNRAFRARRCFSLLLRQSTVSRHSTASHHATASHHSTVPFATTCPVVGQALGALVLHVPLFAKSAEYVSQSMHNAPVFARNGDSPRRSRPGMCSRVHRSHDAPE